MDGQLKFNRCHHGRRGSSKPSNKIIESNEDNEHEDMENPDEGGLIPRRQGNQRRDLEFLEALEEVE